MSGLRVLSLDEPWASLMFVAPPPGIDGRAKRWETRGLPLAGPMRPPGVQAMPGHAVPPGSVLAIHATDRAPLIQGTIGAYRVTGDLLYHQAQGRPVARLMRRRILGTVEVTHAALIIEPDTEEEARAGHGRSFVIRDGDRLTWIVRIGGGGWIAVDISEQLPYGDWRPGRWGIRTRAPRRTSVQCPWCAGNGFDRTWIDCDPPWPDCPVCLGAGGCAPIVTPGGQGVWTWPKKGAHPARSTRVRARVFLSSRAADEDTLEHDESPANKLGDYPTESVTDR